MKIQASVILSFVTGRLYAREAPTVLFTDIVHAASGNPNVNTLQLSEYKKLCSEGIIAQCPAEFQNICNDWQHTDDWAKRVQLIDETFGQIEISRCI
jgi:hypothetical protein